MRQIPTIRIASCNQAPINPDGEYVLYWMIANRRPYYNFALDHAVAEASRLHTGLVVLEALHLGDPWASDRLHTFVVQGMAANARAFGRTGARYMPYVESRPGAGEELLGTLSRRACLVVTDRYPAYVPPRMVATAAASLTVRIEAVDTCGLLPLDAAAHAFPSAYAFRRFLQKVLPAYLEDFPSPDPLAGALLPPVPLSEIAERWPCAPLAEPARLAAVLTGLPIDHTVPPSFITGGWEAAVRTLDAFCDTGLARYGEERNHPDASCTSGLSPFLHHGHISVHEVLARLGRHEGWTPDRLMPGGAGKRAGWWRMSAAAEAFLDELVTWRELGFNFAATRDDLDSYDSLPTWARQTLDAHATDVRPYRYDLQTLWEACTHDPVWNAAQRQLVREGRIHNYLRMLWGKKILEWSSSPREALAAMLELNNRLALDGCDPNSATGILWCLGRYDRPWGPERPIFGTIRTMSSQATLRKVRMREYLERFGP